MAKNNAIQTNIKIQWDVHLTLGIVLLLSWLVRLKSAWFGYPLITHPDEPILVNNALRIFNSHDFNPHFFNYPSLVIYLQTTTTAALSHAVSYISDTTPPKIPLVYFHVAGRIVAGAASTVSVFTTYLIGRRMAGPRAGILSAAMVGLSPIHIRNSALVTTDIWVAIFSVFVLLFSIKIRENPSFKNYLLAGFFVGLATGSKYTAITFFSAIFVAHFFSGATGWSRFFAPKLVASGALTLVTFVVSTPFSVIDHQHFLADLAFERNHYRHGHPGNEAEGDHSYALYADALFSPDGLGPAGVLFFLLGIILLLKEKYRTYLCIVVLPLILFLFVGNYKVFFSRNIVSLIPALSLSASYFIAHLIRKINNRIPDYRLTFLIGAFIVSVVLIPIFYKSCIDLKERLLPDTRWISLNWVNNNISKGSVIAREVYTPPVDRNLYKVIDIGFGGLVSGKSKIGAHVDYVILSSRWYGRFFDPYGNPLKPYEEQAKVYQDFFSENKLIYQLEATPRLTTGPTIRVYEITLAKPKG